MRKVKIFGIILTASISIVAAIAGDYRVAAAFSVFVILFLYQLLTFPNRKKPNK